MVIKKLDRNDTRPAAREPMADPKDQGMTAREAAERVCTDWARAGVVSGDPGDAESQLTKMLAHKIDPADSRRARWRARENTPQPAGNDEIRALAVKVIRKAEKKGVLDRGVQSDREAAVFRAMKSIPRDADQFDVPAPRRLWATGRRFGTDITAPHKLRATDLWFFEERGELKVDIKANAAVGADGGLEYVNLRIYDAEPTQAVSGDAQDAVANIDAIKACDDQLQQTPELPKPVDPQSSAVRPNRAGRKKGSGSWDSEDAPLLVEMQALVENEEPLGLWDAALSAANRARGKGSPESKAKRLVKKYKEKHDLR